MFSAGQFPSAPCAPTAGGDAALEVWGGVECTVNRVGDRFTDQLERNGHAARADDLDRFAALGLRALRHPVLWERVAPDGLDRADWAWVDERMVRLQGLGIAPIVGFVHHGSGPRGTSLVDPHFPAGLARFARAFAERYPWVEAYTPVNEPLTTARFSGLYGHWYPHGRDARTFVRALLTQCHAIALAMREVRAVNPAAQLVQTEDLGATWSTPRLAYQANWENERRWLSWDLLDGRVDAQHPLWAYLVDAGALGAELRAFLAEPCPADVLGVNHYVTSERFLDERLERYPVHTHGGNGRHQYADVEAVRVLADGLGGLQPLLRETWARYGRPIAVTEIHLGCHREDQLRWLAEMWTAARRAREEGADVRAVTIWSLLGAFDWDSLLTRDAGHYEPGAFDVRAPRPRPTALAQATKELAAGRELSHPVLAGPGWWQKACRLTYLPVTRVYGPQAPARLSARSQRISWCATPKAARPLLITGANGTLGHAFTRLCDLRGLARQPLGRADLDVADASAVRAALARWRPWTVVNAAGYARVNGAEWNAEACFRANIAGPAALAEACAEAGVAFVAFSSDLIFDGQKEAPYVESDPAAPLSVYGRSKAEMERRVLDVLPGALIVRTAAFFGPWDRRNFIFEALRALAQGKSFAAADDVVVSPTYVPDLVHAALDLLVDGKRGVWHLANGGAVSPADLARMAAERAGVASHFVQRRPAVSWGLPARRPRWSVLGSECGSIMPPLEDALSCYFRDSPLFPPSSFVRTLSPAS